MLFCDCWPMAPNCHKIQDKCYHFYHEMIWLMETGYLWPNKNVHFLKLLNSTHLVQLVFAQNWKCETKCFSKLACCERCNMIPRHPVYGSIEKGLCSWNHWRVVLCSLMTDCWCKLVKLPSYECHLTLLMVSQIRSGDRPTMRRIEAFIPVT